MEWLLLFIISWSLFFLLIDWKAIKTNIWGGIMAVVLQMLVDTQAINHGYYVILKCSSCIFGSSSLFAFGPVFCIGVLMAQYHPLRRYFVIFNILVLAGLYSLQELILLYSKALVYTNWHYHDSIQVNISAMIILSWFNMIILNKGNKS